MYRFTDCVNACERFKNPARVRANASCDRVSYDLDDLTQGVGNCWLNQGFSVLGEFANGDVRNVVVASGQEREWGGVVFGCLHE